MTVASADDLTDGVSAAPSFNLWTEPWIRVVQPDGATTRVGLRDCLAHAHEFAGLTDSSPLVVVGVHRLLAAVLQWQFHPQSSEDVRLLSNVGCFDSTAILNFGSEYGHRFDLFSVTEPFMQTSDVGLATRKGTTSKTVAYLFPEAPTATNVAHWAHRYDHEHAVCPACAAAGLVTIPAFATSGGAGIRPSINGVPPLYVVPLGDTLFEALVRSLVAPSYQPKAAAASDCDTPAWAGDTIVPRGYEVHAVGYVESLTFPARRVRLFPERNPGRCTRCGERADIRTSRIVFEMGAYRSKESASWLDPFAAYTLPKDRSPVPVRPRPGRAVWREYGTLFLSHGQMGDSFVSPGVVQQLGVLERSGRSAAAPIRVRCIGMRTDMKAKIFEWVDDSLDTYPALLAESAAARAVRIGLDHAEAVARLLREVFRESFSAGRKRDRYVEVRERMIESYWTKLADSFVTFILSAGSQAPVDVALDDWDDAILSAGRSVFRDAVDAIGDRGRDLEREVRALQMCNVRLAARRREWAA